MGLVQATLLPEEVRVSRGGVLLPAPLKQGVLVPATLKLLRHCTVAQSALLLDFLSLWRHRHSRLPHLSPTQRLGCCRQNWAILPLPVVGGSSVRLRPIRPPKVGHLRKS